MPACCITIRTDTMSVNLVCAFPSTYPHTPPKLELDKHKGPLSRQDLTLLHRTLTELASLKAQGGEPFVYDLCEEIQHQFSAYEKRARSVQEFGVVEEASLPLKEANQVEEEEEDVLPQRAVTQTKTVSMDQRSLVKEEEEEEHQVKDMDELFQASKGGSRLHADFETVKVLGKGGFGEGKTWMFLGYVPVYFLIQTNMVKIRLNARKCNSNLQFKNTLSIFEGIYNTK